MTATFGVMCCNSTQLYGDIFAAQTTQLLNTHAVAEQYSKISNINQRQMQSINQSIKRNI